MMVAEGLRASMLALALVAIAIATALVILPRLGFDGFAQDAALFLLMAATALFKPLSDLTNTGLYTLHLDRMLAAINLVGVALSVVLGVVATLAFGLVGIGIAGLLTQLLLIGVRLWCLRAVAPKA